MMLDRNAESDRLLFANSNCLLLHASGFMMCTLPKLDWFLHDCHPFEAISMACLAGITATFANVPEAWLGPPRKQLSAEELAQKTAIVWDIPMAELEALLSKGYGDLWSPTSYLAGAGLQLGVKLSREDSTGPYSLGVHVCLTDHTMHYQKLVAMPSTFSCTYVMERLVPGEAAPCKVSGGSEALKYNGQGNDSVLTASCVSDLEPHLVDGCLKLRLYVHKIM
jgi:hypothetical protein